MRVSFDDPVDLPALFGSADRESGRAQRSYLTAFKIRVGALLLAAFGGALTLTIKIEAEGATDLELGGAVAFVAFACALGAELFMATTKPLETWYEGRAAAESAKTLAWRYMVCGEPFEVNASDVDNRFLAQTYSLLQDLGSAPVGVGVVGEHQITDKMRQVRALSLDERRQLYLECRIQDQQRWYAEKCTWNDRRARVWMLVSIVLEIAGLVGGALTALGWIPFDLPGFLAAAAGTATAWLEAKQHRNLSTAYGIASQELAAIATELATIKNKNAGPPS